MEAALYDPDFGYYTKNVGTVGRRGDFSTSATLSEQLGQGIANWIRERSEGKPVSVIELGAGDGSLAQTILKSANWRERRRWDYQIVEISPRLREIQREKLGKSARWADSIEAALDSAEGEALIFSNELVDAFPVILAAWDGAAWREIRIAIDREAGLREVFAPLDPENLDSTAFERDWPAGQRIEIHDSFRRWISKLGSCRALLTIDYGGSVDEIFNRRPNGTLRGYFRHQRIEGGGIYQRFGKQDLTADVNFDDLQRWGRQVGLETVAFETQAEWIARWAGPDARTAESDAGFRVLEQRPIP